MQTWNQTIQLTYINALGLCLNFVFHPCTDIKISIWGVYELNSEHPQAIYVTRVAIGMHFGNPKSSPRGGRCSAAKIWINPFTEVWNRPTQWLTRVKVWRCLIAHLKTILHLSWFTFLSEQQETCHLISLDWKNVFLASFRDFQYSWSDSSNTRGRRGLGACCRLVRSPFNYSPSVECIQEL